MANTKNMQSKSGSDKCKGMAMTFSKVAHCQTWRETFPHPCKEQYMVLLCTGLGPQKQLPYMTTSTKIFGFRLSDINVKTEAVERVCSRNKTMHLGLFASTDSLVLITFSW